MHLVYVIGGPKTHPNNDRVSLGISPTFACDTLQCSDTKKTESPLPMGRRLKILFVPLVLGRLRTFCTISVGLPCWLKGFEAELEGFFIVLAASCFRFRCLGATIIFNLLFFIYKSVCHKLCLLRNRVSHRRQFRHAYHHSVLMHKMSRKLK